MTFLGWHAGRDRSPQNYIYTPKANSRYLSLWPSNSSLTQTHHRRVLAGLRHRTCFPRSWALEVATQAGRFYQGKVTHTARLRAQDDRIFRIWVSDEEWKRWQQESFRSHQPPCPKDSVASRLPGKLNKYFPIAIVVHKKIHTSVSFRRHKLSSCPLENSALQSVESICAVVSRADTFLANEADMFLADTVILLSAAMATLLAKDLAGPGRALDHISPSALRFGQRNLPRCATSCHPAAQHWPYHLPVPRDFSTAIASDSEFLPGAP
jgi:hypothetical protein